ncbi:lasso peptide biosynthesis PqqD family chaperone [Paenibacillus sp. CF384]|uniref:lasso peptide biosynthesis PqqD family chaperone n=1 Tax=Paenibacillus sp. CF384 TaxID=1884382 RepID=UPI00089B38A5|nr:lasso peptide biosynthesis PqqD family chaperone [Paenibacillus sp. CF384]SDX12348.1 Coenzyme PQQ synthesis protein D (PqqD) [Paenibacillus sp. CF384]
MTNVYLAEQQITQSPDSIVSDMNGEKVMFSIASGKYYNLGLIGGRIWELIATPTTARELVEKLLQEYNVSRTACEEQVDAFLRRLHQESLIEVRNLEAHR